MRAARCLLMSALAASTSTAGVFTLEATGTVEMFGSSFDGAGLFPFNGLSEGDAMEFRFAYDTAATPVSNDGSLAFYEFSGTDSWVRLGDNTVQFDWIRIGVGTSFAGSLLSFSGFSAVHDMSAGLQLEGPGTLSTDLPTALELGDFPWFRASSANSDLNQLLLPIVMGTVDTAVITPSPAGLGLLGFGLAAGWSRRR